MKKITNVWICKVNENSVEPVYGEIIFDNNIIEIITNGDIKNYNDITEIYDAGGRVLTIPNVNFHDHIYSRLAKGLNIIGPTDNFLNILKSLWWKLDLLLDLEMVKASAQYAAIESIKNGVTYIFDHHASPTNTIGSLATISEVFSKFNIRRSLSFEISDRNGEEISNEAVKETIDLIEKVNDDLKIMLGLHASFTVNDSTLLQCSEILKNNDLGIHIHLCEDKVDREESLYKFENAPVQRLIDFELLNDKSLLAHGNHLTQEDYKSIKNFGAALVYNPESNLNNNVGFADYLSVPMDIPVLCGTDGMHSKPFQSFKQLYLLARNQQNSFNDVFNWMVKIYFNQIYFAKKIFPDFTKLHKGDRADFIVWDYIPPNNINRNNFLGHYIYGILETNIKTVIQNGNFLMKDFNLPMVDENEIYKEILMAGKKINILFNNK